MTRMCSRSSSILRTLRRCYLSACSGIYKSENGGAKFTGGVGVNKTQGIPSTARRTRVLMQDPQNLNIVFAGTTEGLYRTGDSGARLAADDRSRGHCE